MLNTESRVGVLDDAIIYLSGGIDCVPDSGIIWRRHFIELIHKNNLNIHCIDPTNKPVDLDKKIGEGLNDKEIQEELQRSGAFDELKSYVSKYRRFDLRFVDISDILIAHISPGVPQWGTSNEIYVSEEQHKPRFAICEGGWRKMPRWLLDVFNENDIFNNVEETIERLKKIDSGEIELDNKWILVRKYLK